MKIFSAFIFLGIVPAVFAAEAAQIVFINGNMETVNERQENAEAIAVRGDRIVFVGSNEGAKKFQTPDARTIDLGDKQVVPGMTDSNRHIFRMGERELT